jgi:hypothetical protein
MADALADIASRLDAISEDLAEAALDRLRTAMATSIEGEPPPEVVAEERRVTRARRAVEKAAALLRGPDLDPDS